MNRIYLCIDLKSFYASVECVARELDPLTTNLVVADKERTDKTICLAVTPSLKAYGISGRARLFEVVQRVEEINRYRRSKAPGRKLDGESYDDPELKRNPSLALSYIVAPPRMSYYMETSARIYDVYLKFIAPEDIHVYSIDEVFIDLTPYLKTYQKTPREMAETQIDYYTKLAKKKKSEWNMVEIFADEGISGMKAKNRPEFQRMIRMCELHQIDLIVTKSVSRFARNVKEALEYVRNLKLLGVGVIFEKEGINTMSLGDEMLLNTFTAIAQEESKAISQNQRLSIVKRMELGVYVDSNAPYGFHLENKQLVEYPPEADIVRWIFQAYLRGMSTAEIAKDLSDRGVPTKNGKEKWKSSKISYMLSNERYIGDCCYQKTYRGTTVPFKQSKNRGEEDMYYATGTHAPIVEKDLFEKVQVLLKKRKEQFTKATTQNIYPLSSRIRCSECGSFYRRKVRSGGVKWVCARHEEDFKACNSNYYSEERRRGTHVACGEQPSGHRYS